MATLLFLLVCFGFLRSFQWLGPGGRVMHSDDASMREYQERLESPDDEVRIDAYREMGDLGIANGYSMLMEGLSDPSLRVRSAVAGILAGTCDE